MPEIAERTEQTTSKAVAMATALLLLVAGLVLIYLRGGILAWLGFLFGAGLLLKAWFRPSKADLPLSLATVALWAVSWPAIFYYVISTWETGEVVELTINTASGSHTARTWILEEPATLVLYYDAPKLAADALLSGASIAVQRGGAPLLFERHQVLQADEMAEAEVARLFGLMSKQYGERNAATDIYYGFLGRASDRVGMVIKIPRTQTDDNESLGNGLGANGEKKMNEANLTRFGPTAFNLEQSGPSSGTASFRALEGPAKLILKYAGAGQAQVEINGGLVAQSKDFDTNGELVVPLALKQENTLAVSGTGQLNLRITQVAQADLGLMRQGYFGLNTSNMERQRAFYEMLGFIGEIYPAGPETSTTFAQALGFEDNYLIYVSLHSLEDPPTMPFVDTVQFRGESFRSEPPYAKLNHIGMAYATYSTSDLDGAYTYLKSKDVEFVSPPASAPNGERFVFFKDQDGAFLKLLEVAEEAPTKSNSPANLGRLVNTNMNVTDLERSREFYRLLGFTESVPNSQSGDGAFAAAHGFDEPIAFEGVDVSLGEGTDGATLQLRQWQTPFDDEPPYPPPVNHLGIDRINFYVKDLTATVKAMNELGFEQLGPIGGSPEIGIVFFFDPDGIKVQVAGPQTG